MGPTLNSMVSSLQRSGTCINSLIAALTIGGQQLFSSFMFRCPCQVGKNFYYGSAFLVLPALILLVAGYALRSQMWTMTSEYCCSCTPPHRRISLLERKLACLRFLSITGRALIAPLTWLAANLMTGTYYECAASEFASVDHYPAFENISASKWEEIIAGFPCHKSAPSDVIVIRDEVALLHRYQSQVSSWLLFLLSYPILTTVTGNNSQSCCFSIVWIYYRTQARYHSSKWFLLSSINMVKIQVSRPGFEMYCAIY